MKQETFSLLLFLLNRRGERDRNVLRFKEELVKAIVRHSFEKILKFCKKKKQNNLVIAHLSKRNVMEVLVVKSKSEFLAQGLHVFEWIDARGEDEEDWSPWPALLVGFGKLDLAVLNVLRTHLLLYEATTQSNNKLHKYANKFHNMIIGCLSITKKPAHHSAF